MALDLPFEAFADTGNYRCSVEVAGEAARSYAFRWRSSCPSA